MSFLHSFESSSIPDSPEPKLEPKSKNQDSLIKIICRTDSLDEVIYHGKSYDYLKERFPHIQGHFSKCDDFLEIVESVYDNYENNVSLSDLLGIKQEVDIKAQCLTKGVDIKEYYISEHIGRESPGSELVAEFSIHIDFK